MKFVCYLLMHVGLHDTATTKKKKLQIPYSLLAKGLFTTQ
jgi:hypothetical protein